MSLADVIDAVRPSVVQIGFTVFGLTEEQLKELGASMVYSKPLGTGFFVNDEAYVITAHHVIAAARKLGEQFPDAEVRIGVGMAYENTETCEPTSTWWASTSWTRTPDTTSRS